MFSEQIGVYKSFQIQKYIINFDNKNQTFMKLESTIVLSNNNGAFKTNHRAQFSNFGHPLKVLRKTDNEMLQMIDNQKGIVENIMGLSKTNYNYSSSSGFEKIKNKAQEKSDLIHKKEKQKTKHKQISYFNEDIGILEHIYQQHAFKKFKTKSNSSLKSINHSQTIENQELKPKCCVLFGFSLTILRIEQFQQRHKYVGVQIKFFKYNDSNYFKQLIFECSDDQSLAQNPDKYQSLFQILEGDDFLDCEQISFVLILDSKSTKNSQTKLQNQIKPCKFGESKVCNENCQSNKLQIFFFPNINALKSIEEKRQYKTSKTLGMPMGISGNDNQSKGIKVGFSQDLNQFASMTSLRKFHQNFRTLQVIEYYLKLDCHADHTTINSNQSRIISELLSIIYQQQVQQIQIYIDHERKNPNRTGKSTARSISGKMSTSFKDTPQSYDSNVYTSDICSEKQFISLDGQILMNDEFLSKLAELKVPADWLDNLEFRKLKKEMYQMKLQENTLLKEIRNMKNAFTDNINYLNNLVGLPKLSYDQITVDTLKQIKNSKIRQNTKQLKELVHTSHNLNIRYENLKLKKVQFQNQQSFKAQQYSSSLNYLRKDIQDIQNKIGLTKNHLNALYHTQFLGVQNEANSAQKTQQKSHQSLNETNTDSALKGGRSPQANRKESFLGVRKTSCMLTKYAPALQKLRKKKYEETLMKEKTKKQFESEKQYQNLKLQYRRAAQQLTLILGDCD